MRKERMSGPEADEPACLLLADTAMTRDALVLLAKASVLAMCGAPGGR